MTYHNFDIATLYEVAIDTRDRILGHSKYYTMGAQSENRVREQLINPILNALGWDLKDQQKVVLEYDTIAGSAGGSPTSQSPQAFTSDAKRKTRSVDYALCLDDAGNSSPCAIIEAKKIKNSSNFPIEDLSQLFAYNYNIIHNELAYKGDLLYKAISDGNTWLIFNGEKRAPMNQLICEIKFSDINTSIDTIIANLCMLSFPAIEHKAKKKLYINLPIPVPLSKHVHEEGLGHKYASITIDGDKLLNEKLEATKLWNLVLDWLVDNNKWKNLVSNLPIKTKDNNLILEDCKKDISSLNRNKNGGRGNNDIYVFEAEGTEVAYEASAGVPKILEDIKVVLEKCNVDTSKVYLEIKMDS